MNIAIITAGGSGKRMNSKIKKQFIEIADRPILCWTLDHFINHPQINDIIITLPQNELENFRRILENEYPDSEFTLIPGGAQRQDSILNALQVCPSKTEYVLIHDAVRPFINAQLIFDLLQKVKQADGVLPVTKIKNTIKEIAGEQVKKTVPRENLVNALTPQVFRFPLILELHQKAKAENLQVTDDASLCETYGYKVKYWLTAEDNFKITDSYDLEIAKFIIEKKFRG
ncbi:MAG: 2-C-methyl-D-erythritol 4-phosphate cytidylyltransferase [Candidatus Cloacimonadota bacterium]|nr:2-C-methyl-D-erythritol 4-phosphate cytidylyltransferase [Candidatus Cloacimonadota bacterium]